MIKVIYCKDGQPISDFNVYDAVDDMIEVYNTHSDTITQDIPIKTSNELYMLVFGLRVLEEKIPIDEVEFYFEDDKLEFDPCLGILDQKDKNLGFFTEVSEKAIMAGYKKMMQNRSKTTSKSD